MKKNFGAYAAAIGMLVLILDAKTALSGAREGVELCIRSVVPSLFPFLVLSALVTGAFRGSRIPVLGWLCRLAGIPEGSDGLLAVSILGGYPAGAASVGQLYQSGQLSRDTARRLLMFCSNAGPAFIFGIVGPKFSAPWAPWALWGIQILSSLAVGFLLPGKAQETAADIPGKTDLTAALTQSVTVMARICGWVVLFRTGLSILDRHVLWCIPEGAVTMLHGLFELTCGCLELGAITDEGLRFLATAVLLTFGGMCVALQTSSVTAGLGMGAYLKGKLLQTLISAVLAWILLTRQVWGMALLVITAIFLREMQKRSSNPGTVGV